MDNISTIHSTSDEWVVGRYGNGVRLFTPNEAQPNQYTLKRFKHMPFNAYLLTPDSAICWLNDNTAETMGFSSHASAHGKTMLDISPEENAMQVIKTDHIVIHHNLLQVIHDNIIRKDGMEHNFISIKVPCYNNEGHVSGLFGCSIPLNSQSLTESLLFITQLGLLKESSIPTFAASNNLLTPRQEECLFYLVKGMTMKQIAAKLNLSPKTIEHYLNNIKIKLDCHSRTELIEKGLEIPAIKNRLF